MSGEIPTELGSLVLLSNLDLREFHVVIAVDIDDMNFTMMNCQLT